MVCAERSTRRDARSTSRSATRTVVGSSDVPFLTIEPEARLSWRQYLDARHTWYIEPGIGGGAVAGYLDIQPEKGTTGPSIC